MYLQIELFLKLPMFQYIPSPASHVSVNNSPEIPNGDVVPSTKTQYIQHDPRRAKWGKGWTAGPGGNRPLCLALRHWNYQPILGFSLLIREEQAVEELN